MLKRILFLILKQKLKQIFTVRVALKKVAFFHFIKKAIILSIFLYEVELYLKIILMSNIRDYLFGLF